MKGHSSPESEISNSRKRSSTPDSPKAGVAQQDQAKLSSGAHTADASVEKAVDKGEGSDGGASRAGTARTLADSPPATAGASFAFAGSADCPTPAPMGQKVSRPKVSTAAAPTGLFASSPEHPAAEGPKQSAATEAGQSQLLPIEQGSTQPILAASAEKEISGNASPVEIDAEAPEAKAPHAVSAVTSPQPVQPRGPIRPQALLPPAMAGVCESRSKVFVPDPRASADMDSAEAAHPAPQISGSQSAHVKVLDAIVDKLCALDPSQTFTHPVPASVPGYAARIKHPMCLSNMRRRVRACEYHTWRQLTSDFSLIINNAHAFNSEGDQWYRAASTLERNGRMVLKEEEETGSAAVHAMHSGGVHAAVEQERAEAEAAARARATLAPAKRPRPPVSSPGQAVSPLPGTPRTPPGHPGAATGASGPGHPRSTSLSSAGATDSAARVSLDAATAAAGDAAAVVDDYATEPDLCYSSFSDSYDSGEGTLDPDLGSLFRRLQPAAQTPGSAASRGSGRTAQPLGGTVTARRLAAVTAHLQQRTVEMPLLGGSGKGAHSGGRAETILPRRQRGKPTKAAILSAEAALAADAAKAVQMRPQGGASAATPSVQPANSIVSAALVQDSPDVAAASAAAPAPGRQSKRKASKAWQQERDSVAWRGHFASLRMQALQHEHRRLQHAEEARQAKSSRLRGPGTPPQAGATVSPSPAPLPVATKRRRKRAAFPHLSAAELLVHPVFGMHANMGKPLQLPYQTLAGGKIDQFSSAEVAAQAAATASQPSAYYVFPAGTHGAPPLPPLRLLRSNAAGFGDVNAGAHNSGHPASGLDLPKARDRAAQLRSDAAANGGDSAGSPAMAARARARQTSASQASFVKMGSAGGSDAEAAYATAAAGATGGQVPGEDDVFYAARVHAVLDVVRHETAGNRELLNAIIRSDQSTAAEPGKRPGTAAARVRSSSGAARPASARARIGGQPAKPSKRRREEGNTDPGTPHTATGIGAPKFVERQKAVEIPLPEVRLLSSERRAQQAANIERFRAEAKLKAKSFKAKSAGSKATKAAGKAGEASPSGAAVSPSLSKEALGGKDQDPDTDASDEDSFLRRHLPLEEEERQRFMSYSSGSGPMKSRAKGGAQKVKGGATTPRAGASASGRAEPGPARTATAPAALMGPPPPKEAKKGGLQKSTSEKKGRNRKGPSTPTAATSTAAAAATTPLTATAGKASTSALAAPLSTLAPSKASKIVPKGTTTKAPTK